MKKILVLLLLLSLLSGSVLPLSAGNDITVTVDGKVVAFDVQPEIIEGRTMVPLRKIFEALGATVDYQTDTRQVIATRDFTKVSLFIGDKRMTVNNVAKALDVPGMIIDGRTLVPLRAIGEAFGCTVSWNGTTRTATIVSNEIKIPEVDTGRYVNHDVLTFSAKTGIPVTMSYLKSDDKEGIPGYVEGAEKYLINTEYCTDDELYKAFTTYISYLKTNCYWAKLDSMLTWGHLDSYVCQYTLDGIHFINLYYMHPRSESNTNRHQIELYVVTWDE